MLEHQQPLFIIPRVVLSELDGLKSSTSLGFKSRTATSWLLSALAKTKEAKKDDDLRRPLIRGQRREESLISKGNNHDRRSGDNDALVLDSCLYFRENVSKETRVIILTDDKNLALRAEFENIEIVIERNKKLDVAYLFEFITGVPLRSSNPTSAPAATLVSLSTPNPTKSLKYVSPITARSRSAPPNATSSPSSSKSLEAGSLRLVLARMEIDDLLLPLPFPTLPPPLSPLAIYHSIVILFVYHLAHPIYCHLSKYLDKISLIELGDWRDWKAVECLRIMQNHWDVNDHGVKELCRIGLEEAQAREKIQTKEANILRGDELDELARLSNVAMEMEKARKKEDERRRREDKRRRASSMWATPTPIRGTYPESVIAASSSSAAAASSSSSAIAPAASSQSPSASAPAKVFIPTSTLLIGVHHSIPRLVATLETISKDPTSIDRWGAPRFDVLLEQINLILSAVSGGHVTTGTGQIEVAALMRSIALGLINIGVDGIDLSSFV
jgi:rRNA-processing protein FCF1